MLRMGSVVRVIATPKVLCDRATRLSPSTRTTTISIGDGGGGQLLAPLPPLPQLNVRLLYSHQRVKRKAPELQPTVAFADFLVVSNPVARVIAHVPVPV